MTKEELKQEAEESARKNWLGYPLKQEIFKQGYFASAEPREKRIAELEKENAELKARLKEHESIGNAQFWENVWSWKTKAEQLTKAKELLKQWLQTSKASGCDNINIVTDTEQFLNSEVEK